MSVNNLAVFLCIFCSLDNYSYLCIVMLGKVSVVKTRNQVNRKKNGTKYIIIISGHMPL